MTPKRSRVTETAGIKERITPRSTYRHLNKDTRQRATFFYTHCKVLTALGKSGVCPRAISGNMAALRLLLEVGETEKMTTPSFEAREFRKTADCPSSQTLLRYRRHRLPISERATIQIHLRSCDFCNAELQLLRRDRGDAEESSCAKMPAQLRELAEKLLAKDRSGFEPLIDLKDRHQLSH